MLKLFKPAPPIERMPDDQIDSEYKKFRLQVFSRHLHRLCGILFNSQNFSLAMPYLIEEGFSKSALGFALSALSISYGLSKFVMATISDRSNPRMFLPAGLILSAVISLLMGFVPFFTSSIAIMFIMLFLNGWFQGMGWPPSGRVLVHWFSVSERGNKTAIWNVAHNVGGGLMAPIAVAGVAIFSGITGSATGYEGVFICPPWSPSPLPSFLTG